MEVRKSAELSEEELAQVRKAMEEFCNAPIFPVIKQEEVTVPEEPVKEEVKQVKKPKRWIPWVAVFLAVALVAGIGFGIWSGMPKNHPNSMARKKQTVSVGLGLAAVLNDGSVGFHNTFRTFDTDDWNNIESVSVSYNHAVGLRKDGTVVFSGGSAYGGECVSWSDVVAVSAGSSHTVGLRKDGTVLATGGNDYGQCQVDAWEDMIGIAAGDQFTAGLREDGTVVLTEIQVPPTTVSPSSGLLYGLFSSSSSSFVDLEQYVRRIREALEEVQNWRDIVAISVAGDCILGLHKDGTVVAAGTNDLGECDVEDWENIASIHAGLGLNVGVTADGKIFTAGKIQQLSNDTQIAEESLNELIEQMNVLAAYSDWHGNLYFLCASGRLRMLNYMTLSGVGADVGITFTTVYENVKIP